MSNLAILITIPILLSCIALGVAIAVAIEVRNR